MAGIILHVGEFDKMVLPLIKSVYPNTTIKDFVSVQPMSQPSGLVMYMDYVYGVRVFWLNGELWLEDDGDGELWCPQNEGVENITDKEFYDMREQELIIPDWEIKKLIYEESYGRVDGVTKKRKLKAIWTEESPVDLF